jgi:hypothetical protein
MSAPRVVKSSSTKCACRNLALAFTAGR